MNGGGDRPPRAENTSQASTILNLTLLFFVVAVLDFGTVGTVNSFIRRWRFRFCCNPEILGLFFLRCDVVVFWDRLWVLPPRPNIRSIKSSSISHPSISFCIVSSRVRSTKFLFSRD